ncbi:MAG: diphthine--ammonia ligase [Endomicrobiales bacterium]|nr:diphthine--ammonia ligase [Endomicrobiales bacterium]
MKIVSSWSGGKDSCLAFYKAKMQGHDIIGLVNFISEEYRRCCFHGTTAELIKLQAEVQGKKLFQREVPADMKRYEEIFKEYVSEIRDKHSIEGMVFGDIYLDEHKEWVERVCKDINIIPLEPLWNVPAIEVVTEFVESGFKSVVVSAKADIFSEDFIGRTIDKELIDWLVKKNICPCGENGEFHSFVYDGPTFDKKIELTDTEKVLREGFAKYWFLDMKKYKLVNKLSGIARPRR